MSRRTKSGLLRQQATSRRESTTLAWGDDHAATANIERAKRVRWELRSSEQADEVQPAQAAGYEPQGVDRQNHKKK